VNLFVYILILSVVQGITEFLPVSSTGHMILVDQFINPQNVSKNFKDAFLVIVQFGSILSVLVYFWKDINPLVKDKKIMKEKFTLWTKILVGILPAGIIGILIDDYITEYFYENSLIIALMLIVYGIAFLFTTKLSERKKTTNSLGEITYKTALLVGFFQCLAMIPGTSRSGATIIGGLLLGMNKSVIAEFSFFLAIPTMFGATLLKLIKNGVAFESGEWTLMIFGTIMAFLVSLASIKWLMAYIKKKDFKVFGIYRIIVGIIVILALNVF